MDLESEIAKIDHRDVFGSSENILYPTDSTTISTRELRTFMVGSYFTSSQFMINDRFGESKSRAKVFNTIDGDITVTEEMIQYSDGRDHVVIVKHSDSKNTILQETCFIRDGRKFIRYEAPDSKDFA